MFAVVSQQDISPFAQPTFGTLNDDIRHVRGSVMFGIDRFSLSKSFVRSPADLCFARLVIVNYCTVAAVNSMMLL